MSARIVAHRGYHGSDAHGARENTLAAVDAALAAGAEVIEVDVRLTSDGAAVLLHDPTLERLWGDARPVAEMTLAEVAEVGGGRHRIPLLAEALERVAGTGAALLIDMDHPAPAAAAVEAVRTARAEAHTEWCGSADAMRIVREAMPDAVIHLPWSSAEPPRAADLEPLRPTFVNAPHLLVGAGFVAAVHALGARVACWTVDEPAQAAHLARIGADSITTNRLRAIRDAVAADVRDEGARALAIVESLAAHAAAHTRRARTEGVGIVRTKRDAADHVTEVDTAVERDVRAVLGAQFPEHDIVGEEYGGTSDGAAPCWYLDPIDGTANLANGVPWTSFSLALVTEGRPVVAAVLDPVGETPVIAAEGAGAWRGGERIAVPEPADGDPLVGRMVTTELAGARAWPGFVELLSGLSDRGCTLRVPGSGTATLAGVALGRGAAAMVHRYSPIDHAAALLIVAEAGGAVRDESGASSLHPDSGPVFVGASAAAADALLTEYSAARGRDASSVG
ncbi:inositol monophosphatase family protein [Microbacterium halophytorum]|uniref:inositol monophosphatase family protein n=1 Tax=Microbacterium halophytorum TaxID=2067568 RepID=UPI000CFBA30D|nr:inositol monophosphatase family protein [Microbacterium halophytorum]